MTTADRRPTSRSPAACPSADDVRLLAAWSQVQISTRRLAVTLFDDVAASTGLPPTSFQALWFLYQVEGRSAPMSALGRVLGFSTAGVTKLTDRLVDAGLIERTPSAADRRVTLATLTAAGVARIESAGSALGAALHRRVAEVVGVEALEHVAATMAQLASGSCDEPGACAADADPCSAAIDAVPRRRRRLAQSARASASSADSASVSGIARHRGQRRRATSCGPSCGSRRACGRARAWPPSTSAGSRGTPGRRRPRRPAHPGSVARRSRRISACTRSIVVVVVAGGAQQPGDVAGVALLLVAPPAQVAGAALGVVAARQLPAAQVMGPGREAQRVVGVGHELARPTRPPAGRGPGPAAASTPRTTTRFGIVGVGRVDRRHRVA